MRQAIFLPIDFKPVAQLFRCHQLMLRGKIFLVHETSLPCRLLHSRCKGSIIKQIPMRPQLFWLVFALLILSFAFFRAVSTAQFVGPNPNLVVSAGIDRVCKVWDLRQNRIPVVTVRTDSAINRLGVNASGTLIALPMDNRQVKFVDINGIRIGRLPRGSSQVRRSFFLSLEVVVCPRNIKRNANYWYTVIYSKMDKN